MFPNKFVTIIEQPQSQSNTNNNNNSDHNPEPMYYSFGIQFYYWLVFENKTEIDSAYNNGKYHYCDWFIAKKFPDLKQELLNNNIQCITLLTFEQEMQKTQTIFKTKKCKQLKCDDRWRGKDYNISKHDPITFFHLLSLCLYTNQTQLSCSFSSVFRRIPVSESDSHLKSRNANYREWARLLTECVHAFGTWMYDIKSDKILYHGINICLQFSSTFAVFCSPTSTTDSLI
jgi:hypothetical protein